MARSTFSSVLSCVCFSLIFPIILELPAAEGDQEHSRDVDHTEMCSASDFTCTNGQCVMADWRCDGESDCVDNSDEDKGLCMNVTCSADHFNCGESGRCVPEAWRCDGHPDCLNGNDELDCDLTKCKESEFQCKEIKRCISSRWHCDQDIDCDDGTDEIGCTPQPCKEQEFRCSNGRCVPGQWHCDGDIDCGDGSDETGCNRSVSGSHRCSQQEFTCATTSECIHMAWRCDGDNDCHDRSDESPETCGMFTCAPDHFQCRYNFSCIASSLRCDSVVDCVDRSDEEDCPSGVGCNAQTEFDCSESGQHCIPLDRLCDGNDDCGNRADEGSFCSASANPCKSVAGNPCSHECIWTGASFVCKCPPGSRLSNNSRTCEDIDECLIPGICSQDCENREHGYKCKCRPGYELEVNEHRCRAAGSEPVLLFANRHDLRELHLLSGHYRPVVEKLNSAIAIDYDYSENYVYWSDVASETISRRLKNASHQSESNQDLVKHDVSTPDGLALDWIHKNLYWTDTGNNRIEVLSVRDPRHLWRKVLVNTNLDEPRAIVVDPRTNQRYLYWSDWGDTPKIERANLDGSDRTILISKDIEWPNGLTIDYESDLLFWVDAKHHRIWSSDLLGHNRRIVLTSYLHLKHPFALTVFEDSIYWSDWEAESILKVSKFPKERRNNTVKNVAMHLASPMDVHIYHELKQPHAENVCKDSGCSHLCLPRNGRPSYSCVCSDYGDSYFLADDQKTCYSNSSGDSTASVNVDSSSNSTHRTKPSNTSLLQLDKSYASTSNARRIASIVIGAILGNALIVIVVLFIMYRSYRKRTLKSMNFDNPVYRRTTEDQFTIQRNHFQQPKTLSSLLEPLTASNECA